MGLSAGCTWVHLPDDVPRVAPVADFEAGVLGASLIARRAPWIQAQRWWQLPEGGAVYLGRPRHHLRAAYLVARGGFVVEWSGPNGHVRRLGAPATLDDLVRVLRLRLCDGPAFERLPWFAAEHPDEELQGTWTRAYRSLLELPAPASESEVPLSAEERRTDGLRRRQLQPTLQQAAAMRAQLDSRVAWLHACAAARPSGGQSMRAPNREGAS